jgi:hypothetical protein
LCHKERGFGFRLEKRKRKKRKKKKKLWGVREWELSPLSILHKQQLVQDSICKLHG